MPESNEVTISRKEYERLKDRDRLLSCLEAGGVDNWDWYEEAIMEFEKGKDEQS